MKGKPNQKEDRKLFVRRTGKNKRKQRRWSGQMLLDIIHVKFNHCLLSGADMELQFVH